MVQVRTDVGGTDRELVDGRADEVDRLMASPSEGHVDALRAALAVGEGEDQRRRTLGEPPGVQDDVALVALEAVDGGADHPMTLQVRARYLALNEPLDVLDLLSEQRKHAERHVSIPRVIEARDEVVDDGASLGV